MFSIPVATGSATGSYACVKEINVKRHKAPLFFSVLVTIWQCLLFCLDSRGCDIFTVYTCTWRGTNDNQLGANKKIKIESTQDDLILSHDREGRGGGDRRLRNLK